MFSNKLSFPTILIMIDKNFFNERRILDGGMGQELLSRGLKPRGTLWSAEALIKEEYHQLIIDTHLDFINSGAEIIVTNTFTSRKVRLIQNNCLEYFEKINKKAVELALRARDISKKNILIAGGLPNQKQTYSANLGDDLLKRILIDTKDVGKVELEPKFEG